MPANPITGNMFLVNSDYPNDKIVYINSGSLTVADGASVEVNVPHGLTFRPMLIGTWSNDPNFSTSFEQGSPGYSALSDPQLSIQSTATNIRLIPTNFTGSTLTFYYRVYGFMPSDVNESAVFTADLSSQFSLNSEFNYTKLYKTGVLLWNGATQTVNHGLGYRPQIEIWFEQELNSNILTRWYSGIDDSYAGTDKVFVDNTNLTFKFQSSGGVSGRKWYYRIYIDKQA